MTLRDRCKILYDKLMRDAIMRHGSPVDDILEFVVVEAGRGADWRLEASLPVVAYFRTKQDRDEFIAAVQEAKPDMIMKKVP